MAITFTKDISSTDLINAFNNNIVNFKSDNVLQSITCDINIDGAVYDITPNNLNEFRFNFGGDKSPFSTLINQNDFADDKVLGVNPADVSTITIDDSASSYKLVTVIYTITFSDETTETITKTYHVLKSVVQDDDLEVLTTTDDMTWLTPDNSITYFKGYPFDVSFFSADDVQDLSTDDGVISGVTMYDGVSRLILSDGLNSISGINALNNYDSLSFRDLANSLSLNVKVVDGCGEYIKFMNKYGQWNYWLFNDKSKHELSTKNLKQLFNDFDNVGENQSPILEIGKGSKKTISLHSSNVTEDEINYLQYLFESPKIYYYLRNKGEAMTDRSFIEVKLKGTKTIVKNYDGSTYNVKCSIEFKRNTMTL